jgi:hypothetical protein
VLPATCQQSKLKVCPAPLLTLTHFLFIPPSVRQMQDSESLHLVSSRQIYYMGGGGHESVATDLLQEVTSDERV